MSTYRRDQLVSAEVLRLLTLIVPHLNSLGSGQALGSDHRLCCHLLAAFWYVLVLVQASTLQHAGHVWVSSKAESPFPFTWVAW